MEKFYLITFKNTHEAMKADKAFQQNKIKATIMPTPTIITKSCGISIKVDEVEFEKVEKLTEEGQIEMKSLFLRTPEGFRLVK